jgi:epoxyqueuosine reductase
VEKSDRIRNYAYSLGFDEVGYASPSAVSKSAARLSDFVAFGRHGDMHWMERHLKRRGNPIVLWPDVRSVIVVAANYGPDGNPLDTLLKKNAGAISVYARNRDYHKILKGRMKQLGSWIVSRYGGDLKVFVDTAPVMEKPLAEAAGIGWQGKHTNLVSRRYGSWLFLGVMYTSLSLPVSSRTGDKCGSCQSCLQVCPTNAFPAPYQLDARRCISYLTIEYNGVIKPEFRPSIGNRIFGCDDCLAVCPWNKFAQKTKELKLAARDDLLAPDLSFLVGLDETLFRSYFSQSPIKRIGRDRFIRNVLIAIGNSEDPSLVKYVKMRLGDKSALVRGMAVWALANLAEPSEFFRYREDYYAREADVDVRVEWDQVE